tara:strand:- start:2496 stop:3602 length:1107 start_codon:yes stop_codon:yes gene_type:complete
MVVKSIKKDSSNATTVSGSETISDKIMGDNDWILILKLGPGGDNCTANAKVYSCKYLTATASNPTFTLSSDKIDTSTDSSAYKFVTAYADKDNQSMMWNDQGEKGINCGSQPHISAHEKGGIVLNKEKTNGVWMESSSPHWGFHKGFTEGMGGKNPGIKTDFMQHILLVRLKSKDDVKNMLDVMGNSNLCIQNGSIDGFTPWTTKTTKTGNPTVKPLSSGLTIVGKADGDETTDIWNWLRTQYCNNGMTSLSYCSPICPKGAGQSKDAVSNITDLMNMRELAYEKVANGKKTCTSNDCKNAKSVLSTSCGLKFDPFSVNHSKIGICTGNNVVIVGGNNHSIQSQGPRGGMFAVIKNDTLSKQLKCLFK